MPDTHPAKLFMELDRLANLCCNGVPGARWRGSAQRGGSLGLSRVGPTDDRQLGIRCHGGQNRRQRVRSNLPSGLLDVTETGRTPSVHERAAATLNPLWILLMNPPGGDGWIAKPGEITASFHLFSIHFGGMVSREGEDAKSPQL